MMGTTRLFLLLLPILSVLLPETASFTCPNEERDDYTEDKKTGRCLRLEYREIKTEV